MNTIFTVWFFLIGLIFGSFFGVVGSRLPENKSIVKPRSHCTFCNHELKWYELIPVFSYIFQKGKCSKCKRSLSIMYPITELICGLLFALSIFKYGFSKELLISILISSLFIIVIVSDITYLIIPDEVTIIFSILILLVKLIFFGFKEFILAMASGALLFCLMYCIMMLGNKIFKKETMGGADIKLMFLVGTVLQPSLGIFDIFIASCLALPISLVFLIKNKNNVIPFGPFIVMGLFLIYSFM